MGKRTITWVRHGQSEWNAVGRWQGHSDIPLSELGQAQACSLGSRLKPDDYDLIYSSDLLRAHETGRLALPESEILVDSRLREINFGIYEGHNAETLDEEARKKVFQWWAKPYDFKLDGGESMNCLNLRVQQWLDELPEDCRVIVFTHGGVVRNALWQIVGPPASGEWSVVVENCSLTVTEYGPRRNLIHRVNDCFHLGLV